MASEEVINRADFGTQNMVEAAEAFPGEAEPELVEEQELDSPLDCWTPRFPIGPLSASF